REHSETRQSQEGRQVPPEPCRAATAVRAMLQSHAAYGVAPLLSLITKPPARSTSRNRAAGKDNYPLRPELPSVSAPPDRSAQSNLVCAMLHVGGESLWPHLRASPLLSARKRRLRRFLPKRCAHGSGRPSATRMTAFPTS